MLHNDLEINLFGLLIGVTLKFVTLGIHFTVGLGTQTIWLGPAKLNPIIHSNNAAAYPKVDIGLRKTDLIIPYFGWNIGAIEARGWWGKLSESNWFDNDDNNNENLISGLAMYYQFLFLKDFSWLKSNNAQQI